MPLGGTGGISPTGGSASLESCSGDSGITGLQIEANPNNALSAFVSWTTATAADSVVQFGEGDYEWETSDPTPVTNHKVLVIGMHASKTYQVKAMSSLSDCVASATDSFTTGALPSHIPIGTVSGSDATKTQPGWTLVNILKSSSSMGPVSDFPATAVMYDQEGQPVWYYLDGKTKDFGGAIATYLTDQGVMLGPVVSQAGPGESPREVDFAGNTIWECSDPLCGNRGSLTHDAIKISNGNHVVVRWAAIGAVTDSDTTFEELDASGNVVWSMSFTELVPKPAGATGDWCHGNAITIDIEKDEVYGECRFIGVVKTSYTNPHQLIWFLPAAYGGVADGLTYSPPTSQFDDGHHPEMHDDGTMLIFDNGGYSMTPGGGQYHSRAVEYKIDEASKTATLVWEFPGTFNVDPWYKNNWYTQYYGDADRLANGNVLITAGSVSSTAGDARVFEVTKEDGNVVWELKFPAGTGVYRADRITPPLVHAIGQ